MLGEMKNQKAVIIYEVENKKDIVTYTVNHNEHQYIDNNQNGPTKVIIDFKIDGLYVIYWYINKILKYKQQLVVNNHIAKLFVVSCDFLEADTKHSLWDTMRKDLYYYQRNAIIHLGDQIYADKVYKQNGDYQDYSDRYCDTYRTHHDLLSVASNYFIWDDHEIVNDAVLDLTNDVHIAATRAYEDYQLSFELEYERPLSPYCWYKTVNDDSIGILSIERTSDIITNDMIIQFLSTCQVKQLIICFGAAFVPAPQNRYGHVYIHYKGTNKFYNNNDLVSLLNAFFNWMGEDKQIIILSGDLHCGIHGYYQQKKKQIPLLLSSPVTNHPSFDHTIIAKGFKNIININGDIKFIVKSAKARRCYGTVDLHDFTTDIVYSRDKYPKNISKYIHTMLQF
jgi:hypothetical protein